MTRGSRNMDGRGRWVAVGLLGGLAGAVLMAIYAMVVSAVYKDVGFFTPLYHIGSAFASGEAMMASMEEAAAGNSFFFDAGPAAVGLLVHMVTGAAAGAVFGALASLVALSRPVTVAAGVLYGVVVLVGNALIGLPVVASLFGGGEPIAEMPAMAGWGTFIAEHLIFGLVLGAVVAAWANRPRSREAADRSAAVAP